MIPTIPWLQQMFKNYNEKYFGGKIPMPRFSLNCPSGNWGYYKPYGNFNFLTRKVTPHSSGILYMTRVFSRTEKDVLNTLLHEMIHMYIILVDKQYPKNQHGKLFQAWADKLNSDGWNISEMNEKQDTDVENEKNSLKPNLLCIIEKPNGQNYKFWCFIPDYIFFNKYLQIARNMKKNGVTFFKVYYYYSHNTPNLPIANETLNGFGGMSFQECLNKLSKFVGEKITEENMKLSKEINL